MIQFPSRPQLVARIVVILAPERGELGQLGQRDLRGLEGFHRQVAPSRGEHSAIEQLWRFCNVAAPGTGERAEGPLLPGRLVGRTGHLPKSC